MFVYYSLQESQPVLTAYLQISAWAPAWLLFHLDRLCSTCDNCPCPEYHPTPKASTIASLPCSLTLSDHSPMETLLKYHYLTIDPACQLQIRPGGTLFHMSMYTFITQQGCQLDLTAVFLSPSCCTCSKCNCAVHPLSKKGQYLVFQAGVNVQWKNKSPFCCKARAVSPCVLSGE